MRIMFTITQEERASAFGGRFHIVLRNKRITAKGVRKHQFHRGIALDRTNADHRFVATHLGEVVVNPLRTALHLFGTHCPRTPNKGLPQMLNMRHFLAHCFLA